MTKLEFQVTVQICELSHVPYKTGVMFAKVRLSHTTALPSYLS